MANDILNGLSPNELNKEILQLISKDQRGLPPRSKIFAAVLKEGSRMAQREDLTQDLRENRNRAKRAGITDLGSFAAALGFDAFYSDYVYEDSDERVYTVLNRGMLIVQKVGILVPA